MSPVRRQGVRTSPSSDRREVARAPTLHGHQVVVGTRDVDATMARSEPDQMGNPPFAGWAAEHADVRLGTFAEAAAGALVVVNATSGSRTLAAMASRRPCRS